MSDYSNDEQKMMQLIMKPVHHLQPSGKQLHNRIEQAVFELQENYEKVSEDNFVLFFECVETLIVYVFNEWLKVSDEKLSLVLEVMEVFDASWTIIDDIQDNTEIRRGAPTTHLVYGTNFSILSAFYSLFNCTSKSFQFNPEAPKIFVDEIKTIFVSLAKECYWKDHAYCPNEDEYIELCDERVGTYLRFIGRCMQLFSENKTDMSRFCRLFGIYAQLCNDYWNLSSSSYMNMKGFAEDLTEGKFTLPLLHAAAKNKEVCEIVQLKTNDVDVKKRCLRLVNECGSMEYTRAKIFELEREILDECKKLGGNTIVESFLKRARQLFFEDDDNNAGC